MRRLSVLKLIFLLISTLGFNQTASAYPNFISYGYGSCLSCHYNPFGNGSLTDYGRALSATEISDRLLSNKKETEEDLTDKSGFAYGQPSTTWLRPSLDYRSLYLKRNYEKESEKDSFIVMDVNATVVAKLLPRDKLTIVGQIAYAPKPRALKGESDVKEYRSREHYVGYRFSKEFGVYAGLMDKVFGIRLPDHTAFSRTVTSLGQNDQTHGAVLHYSTKAVEVGIHPFVGNLVQDEELRQKGVSGLFEIPIGGRTRVGLSALSSTSDYLTTKIGAMHGRIGIGQGNSILIETGQVTKEVKINSASTSSRYLTSQSHLHLRRGLWAILTAEALRPNIDVASDIYRLGPGVQFFPFQRLEVRAEVYKNYIQSPAAKSESLDFALQTHIWL